MTRVARPMWWQRVVQRLAWSKPGAWCFSRTLRYVDGPLLRLSGGRLAVPALLAGLPTVALTTTGAQSGRLRTVPVVALRDGDQLVVIGSNWGRRHHPAWRHNLRAHPEAIVRRRGGSARYTGREAGDDERERYWQQAIELYPGFAAYARRANRCISVFVLTPTAVAVPAHHQRAA